MALAFGQGDVSQAFAEKIGRLYGSSTFGTSAKKGPEARVHSKARRNGLSWDCDVKWLDIPTCTNDGELEVCPWPILLPRDLMRALVDAGHADLLVGSAEAREKYWEGALRDFPCHGDIEPRTTAPINLYGDESTVFRSSCMCLHWEPVLSGKRSDSMLSRFLIAIIPSERYWIAT